MLFEENLKDKTIVKESEKKSITIKLEIEREYNLKRIRIAYSNNIKNISKSKLIKMAIDNLIADVEKLPEEEALEYLRNLYKEAEF